MQRPLRAALFAAPMLLALAAPRPARAEEPRRAATLMSRGTAPYQRALQGFLKKWDGEVRRHDLEFEDDAVARIRSEAPQVVVAVGAKAAKAAQGIGNVPVVYCVVLDPAAQGIGASHVTGVPVEIPAHVQLGQLKQLLPDRRRVGLVFNPARSGAEVSEAQAAGAKLGLELVVEPAASAAEFPQALQKLLSKVDALWLLADSTVVTQDTFRLMLEAAHAQKLPLMVFSDEFVRLGALFALSPDFEASGAEAARLAKEIASGRKPQEVGGGTPKWNLVYNPSTAKALGLTLPEAALKGAVALP
ncbi:MAG: ABC transporter substrate-binding protein [Myxococcales bacterium]